MPSAGLYIPHLRLVDCYVEFLLVSILLRIIDQTGFRGGRFEVLAGVVLGKRICIRKEFVLLQGGFCAEDDMTRLIFFVSRGYCAQSRNRAESKQTKLTFQTALPMMVPRSGGTSISPSIIIMVETRFASCVEAGRFPSSSFCRLARESGAPRNVEGEEIYD